MRRLAALAIVASIVSLVACTRGARTFDTKLVIKSVETVHRDDAGKPVVVEVTVEYPDCPGEQLETFQGNIEFTSCFAKYKDGDSLPATVEWAPTSFGHFDSEITRLGDCKRVRDPNDARSYEVVQDCRDIVVNGIVAGFHCDRKPDKELLDKCPWFARQ